MSLGPDTMVTPNVRLVRPLGHGGMGSVWVADHLGLSTQVAVKFISGRLLREEPGVVERFKREAAAAARIKSPHVVQVFDHGLMTDHRPFMVMELLEGESLGDRGARLGRLSLGETVEITTQVCKALSAAHEQQIVHRDIKPDNIFLTTCAGEMLVKVLDFGIAKQTSLPNYDQLTGAKTLVGTPEYMSPEQVVSARHVTAQADLWALAVVVYQALTGGMPFAGETVGGLIVAITNSQFNSPSTWISNLPSSVDAWFERAFAPNPADRFASALDLAGTLRQALAGVNTMPPPPAQGHTQVEGFQIPVQATPSPAHPPNTFSGASASAATTHTRGSQTGLIVAVAAIGLMVVGATSAVVLGTGGDEPATNSRHVQPLSPSTSAKASATTQDEEKTRSPADDNTQDAQPSEDASYEDIAPKDGTEPEVQKTAASSSTKKAAPPAPRPGPAAPPPKPKETRKERLGF